MFCTKCGAKLPEGAKFCTHCGCPTAGAPQPGQTAGTPAAAKPGSTTRPAAAAPGSQPRPASAASGSQPRPASAAPGTGPASPKASPKSKKLGLVVVALFVCAVLVGGVFLLKGSGTKTGSGEGNSEGTGMEDIEAGAASSAGADQAEAEVSDDAAGKLVDVDADSVTVKIPAITEADFGNGFYDTYSMYYGGTPAVIEDASSGFDRLGNFSVHFPYTSETGEQTESYITVEGKAGGLLSGDYCEINADLYEYFVHDLGMSAQEAEQVNQDLSALMPIQFRWDFDDNEAVRTSGGVHKLLFVIDKIWENTNTDSVQFLVDALYRAMEMESIHGTAETYSSNVEDGVTTISPMQSGALNLNGNEWIFSREQTYYPRVNGEQIITNQPAWTANMEVDPEDMVGKLQVQKDENGNITLVHLYNDMACYDHKFIYDDNGLLWTYEYYEYPKGQKPEDVGPTETREYVYDVDGKLFQANSYRNETGSSGSLELTYDEEGRIIETVSHTDFQGSWGNLQLGHYDTIMETYEYDDAGKVCRVTVQEDMTQGQDAYVYSPTKKRIYTPVQ